MFLMLVLFRTRGFLVGLVPLALKLNFWRTTEPNRGVGTSDGRGVGDCKVARSEDATRRRFEGVPACSSSSIRALALLSRWRGVLALIEPSWSAGTTTSGNISLASFEGSSLFSFWALRRRDRLAGLPVLCSLAWELEDVVGEAAGSLGRVLLARLEVVGVGVIAGPSELMTECAASGARLSDARVVVASSRTLSSSLESSSSLTNQGIDASCGDLKIAIRLCLGRPRALPAGLLRPWGVTYTPGAGFSMTRALYSVQLSSIPSASNFSFFDNPLRLSCFILALLARGDSSTYSQL